MENQIIGIDISSKTLDICLLKKDGAQYFKIDNTVGEIRDFLSKRGSSGIVAMENTGRYNWALYEALAESKLKVFVVSPLHLSKSQGLVRGKDDRTDAYRIAMFALKNQGELAQWRPTDPTIQKIKVLLTERTARIKSKKRLLKQKKDYPKMKSMGLSKKLLEMNMEQINLLEHQIKAIEDRIQLLIDKDETLKKQQGTMLSVPGVGKVTTWMFLAKTEGFHKIKTPGKMACYAGVVPFEHQSGTSIHRRPKVSLYADKEMKSVLHLAAMSAIRLKNDLSAYYQRKVKEGKNKMSVLNAIRNKIIHLVFALVKSGKFYENRLEMS